MTAPLYPRILKKLPLDRHTEAYLTTGVPRAVYWLSKVDLHEVWQHHGERILSTWVEEHPGTRPFAWWNFDAPEPRRERESEAAYLKRLDLLFPGEARRLRKRDYEPEAIGNGYDWH